MTKPVTQGSGEETQAPNLPPAPDFKFSKVVKGMNDVLASVGGSVEIKRKKENGVVEECEDQEGTLKVADFRLKARATQHSMQNLSYSEKKAWVNARKIEGNQYYNEQDYDNAISKYMEAVMGVASGTTEEEQEDAALTLQVPLLTNLSVCMMAKEKWGKARSLLDEAIELFEKQSSVTGHFRVIVKAHWRRGQCFVQMGLLKNASKDFRAALKLSEANALDDLAGSIKHSMRDVRRRVEKDSKFAQKMMGLREDNRRDTSAILYVDRIKEGGGSIKRKTDGLTEKKADVGASLAEDSTAFSDVNSSDEEDCSDLSQLLGKSEADRKGGVCASIVVTLKRVVCRRTVAAVKEKTS